MCYQKKKHMYKFPYASVMWSTLVPAPAFILPVDNLAGYWRIFWVLGSCVNRIYRVVLMILLRIYDNDNLIAFPAVASTRTSCEQTFIVVRHWLCIPWNISCWQAYIKTACMYLSSPSSKISFTVADWHRYSVAPPSSPQRVACRVPRVLFLAWIGVKDAEEEAQGASARATVTSCQSGKKRSWLDHSMV